MDEVFRSPVDDRGGWTFNYDDSGAESSFDSSDDDNLSESEESITCLKTRNQVQILIALKEEKLGRKHVY